MKSHRVRYETVGQLVPRWKLLIALFVPSDRVRQWCLSYAVPGGLALSGLLAMAACNSCDKSIVVRPARAVVWDGGNDEAAHACAVLLAASCPVADGCDKDPNNCDCAVALRADQQAGDPPGTASQVDLGCIVDAGPNPSALRACRVTCQ